MESVRVESQLRQRRVEAGLSSNALAALVGISRQSLHAIETGRQMPSTALALQLARALSCKVDDLFSLPHPRTISARVPEILPLGRQRVNVGEVDGEWVAHPVFDPASPAGGVLLGTADNERVQVRLLEVESAPSARIFVAGCAPLLGLLSGRLGLQRGAVHASWIQAHSGVAQTMAARGLVHLAGVHLADSGDPAAHARIARQAFGGQTVYLIHLARWRQGLVVAAGNPLGLAADDSLGRLGLRFVFREGGSGAQRVLERTLVEAGVQVQHICGTIAQSHTELARRIAWGAADVGVAVEAVALAEGLHFIPLAEERFDLMVPARRTEQQGVSRFLELLDSPTFRAEASCFPGYDLNEAGHALTVFAEEEGGP